MKLSHSSLYVALRTSPKQAAPVPRSVSCFRRSRALKMTCMFATSVPSPFTVCLFAALFTLIALWSVWAVAAAVGNHRRRRQSRRPHPAGMMRPS